MYLFPTNRLIKNNAAISKPTTHHVSIISRQVKPESSGDVRAKSSRRVKPQRRRASELQLTYVRAACIRQTTRYTLDTPLYHRRNVRPSRCFYRRQARRRRPPGRARPQLRQQREEM